MLGDKIIITYPTQRVDYPMYFCNIYRIKGITGFYEINYDLFFGEWIYKMVLGEEVKNA